jgi:hypothetical protein
MKEKKRKVDKRLDVAAWRDYLSDPDAVPPYREDCPCTKRKCERHGKCGECYGHHAAGRLLPYCLRQA